MDYLYDFALVDFTAWIYPSLMVQFVSTRVMQKEQQRMNYKSYFCNDPDSVGCAGFAFRNYTISMCIDPCTFLYCCLECSIARRGKASKSKQIRTKDRRCSPTTKSWMNKKEGFFSSKSLPNESTFLSPLVHGVHFLELNLSIAVAFAGVRGDCDPELLWK